MTTALQKFSQACTALLVSGALLCAPINAAVAQSGNSDSRSQQQASAATAATESVKKPYVQVASLSDADNAIDLLSDLAESGFAELQIEHLPNPAENSFTYKIRVGPHSSERQARKTQQRLYIAGYGKGFLVWTAPNSNTSP